MFRCGRGGCPRGAEERSPVAFSRRTGGYLEGPVAQRAGRRSITIQCRGREPVFAKGHLHIYNNLLNIYLC